LHPFHDLLPPGDDRLPKVQVKVKGRKKRKKETVKGIQIE
jgi:hypothetical protein